MPYLASAGAALVVVLIAFAIGVSTGKHKVVDVAWGLGFAAIAVTSLAFSPFSWTAWLAASLTVVWGVRLAGHIFWRGRGSADDPRYEELLSKARGNRTLYALRMIYLLQGLSLWFISLPVQVVIARSPRLSWFAAIGVAVWLVGFFFETVGDAQLARFRENPANRGKVLNTGLWHYTRHPNYFGDACVWWGLYFVACLSWVGALTVLSPLVMTWLLARKTGKPLMESHLTSSRPGYADYVARTSGFFPLPPR